MHGTPPPDHARIATRGIIRWLMAVAALVFVMVVVGGITRLTESGLSITQWNLVTGTLPPLSDAAWLAEFEKYRQTPEYQQINAGMSLAAFQFIYFWEWAHRLLGRVIGLAFLLPLIWFAVKKQLPAGYGVRLFAIGALILLQGSIGWWMVQSGLSERTDVSHYRLAVHLLTALFILAGLVWTALDLAARPRRAAGITGFSWVVIAALFIQLLFGAYTAGLNAGYISNTWPMMNERVVPDGIDWSTGALAALGNDPHLIHFIHRWWAWVVVAVLVVLARRVKAAGVRPASIAIHSAVGIQILLGIFTVLSGMNIWLAASHQAVGALVVISTAWGVHVLGRR